MLTICYGLFIYLFYSTVQYQKKIQVQLTRLGRLQSRLPGRGPSRWLWLGKISSQAKSRLRPTVWPGLARLFLARPGLASGLRPEPAHHYRLLATIVLVVSVVNSSYIFTAVFTFYYHEKTIVACRIGGF